MPKKSSGGYPSGVAAGTPEATKSVGPKGPQARGSTNRSYAATNTDRPGITPIGVGSVGSGHHKVNLASFTQGTKPSPKG